MLQGRREELERIDAALRAGRAVLIEGRAGIGKSAIVRDLLDRRVGFVGQCSAPLRHRPFTPVLRAFGWAANKESSNALIERVVDALSPDAVFVLEDVQWADPETLELATELCARAAVVMTVRAGDPDGAAAHGLVEWLGGEVIVLGPLPDSVMLEILEVQAPTLVAGERREVIERCGGNTLVANVLAHRLLRPQTRAGAFGSLSGGSAEAVLLGVVAELPSDELRALALLGGSPSPVPSEACACGESLVARGMVVESTEGFQVVDELLAELAWGLLDPPTRRAVHLQLGNMVDGDDIVRAANLLAAGELTAASRLAARAAAGPVTRSEQAEALRICALAELDDGAGWLRPLLDSSPEDLVVLVLDAATALNDLGDFDRAAVLLEVVLDGDWDRHGTVGAAVARQLLRCAAGRDDRTFTRRAVEWVGRGVDAEHDVWLSSWTAMLERSVARKDLDSIEFTAVDQSVDREHLAFLRAVKAYSTDPTAAVRWLEVAVDEATSSTDPMSEMDSTRNLAMLHLGLGNWTQSAAVARRAEAVAEAHGAVSWVAEFKTLEIMAEIALSACDDAAIGWLSWVRTSPARLDTRAMATSTLATVLVDRGAIERSGEILAAWSTPDSLAGMGSLPQAMISWALAQRAWVLGDLDEVARVASWATDTLPPGFPTLAGTQVMWRWAEYESGLPIRSPDPQGGLLPCAAMEASAVQLLAEGATGDAADAFQEAAAAWSTLMLRSALRCRWAAGLSLVLDGREELGAELLEALDAELDQAGVPALRPRVAAAFRLATGRELAGVGTSSVSVLSARQQQVLLLVGEGLSTAQIARRLGLTPDTVNSHVRLAMRKMGARTRVEAAAVVGLGAH